MPMSEATVATTPSVMLRSSQTISFMAMSMPSGMMAMPMTWTSRVRERIISDCWGGLEALASRVRRLAKESAPTRVSRARHSPDTTKLPESSSSPGFFFISSASPVIRASFALHSPSTTTASAKIWPPAEKTTMSSRTISLVGIFRCLPSRMTAPCGSVSSVSLSSVRFERSSCTMPMAMLAMTTPMNMTFCQEPTASTQAASRKKSILK